MKEMTTAETNKVFHSNFYDIRYHEIITAPHLYYVLIHLYLVIATRKAFVVTSMYKSLCPIGNVQ